MSEGIESSSSPTFGKRIGFWLGLLAYFVIPYFLVLDPTTPLDERMAAIAALMAIWWVSDAVPLAATSLLPIVLFPLAGIMDGDKVAPIYMNYVIFLYLGGFLIALAMERWNLHRRIALRIIRVIGSDPSRLVLGFILATAFLSRVDFEYGNRDHDAGDRNGDHQTDGDRFWCRKNVKSFGRPAPRDRLLRQYRGNGDARGNPAEHCSGEAF